MFLRNLLALALMASPVLADTARFEQGFTDICLQSLPTMVPARDAFKANGWAEHQGAGPNEFEYTNGSTHVFLITGQPDEQPGCTVMDESLSQLEAKWVLELALNKYHAGSWREGKGFNDAPAWRLLQDTGTVIFHIQEGMGGGAAISFELRP